jgi:hypothetical protein
MANGGARFGKDNLKPRSDIIHSAQLMRILPDTRDLINLTERKIPAPEAFAAYLRNNVHQILLSYSTIRELSAPLANGGDFLAVRHSLQLLENMPHSYIKEVPIIGLELQSAVQALESGGEYQACNLDVDRWDQTLLVPPGHKPALGNIVGLRLDDIVYSLYTVNPQLFAPPEEMLPILRQLLQADRALLRGGRLRTLEHFVVSVKKHAAQHRVELPKGREDELARWIHSNPSRCPGLRLSHEVYRQLLRNYNDLAQVGDFSDLAQMSAVPYAQAVTLDNRMRHYCSQATKLLMKTGLTVDYREALYRDLNEVMQRNP